MKNINKVLKSTYLVASLFLGSLAGENNLEKNSSQTKIYDELHSPPSLELCIEHDQNYEDLFPEITNIANKSVIDVAKYLTDNGIETNVVENSLSCEKIIFQGFEDFVLNYIDLDFERHKDEENISSTYSDLIDKIKTDKSILKRYDEASTSIIKERLDKIKRGYDFSQDAYHVNDVFAGVFEVVQNSDSQLNLKEFSEFISTFEEIIGTQRYMYNPHEGESIINLKGIINTSTRYARTQNEVEIDDIIQRYMSQVIAHEVLHSFQLTHPWDFISNGLETYDKSDTGFCENTGTFNIMSYGQGPGRELDNYHISGLQVQYVIESLNKKYSNSEIEYSQSNENFVKLNSEDSENIFEEIHTIDEYKCSPNENLD